MGTNKIEKTLGFHGIIKFLGSSGMEPGWRLADARFCPKTLLSISDIMLSEMQVLQSKLAAAKIPRYENNFSYLRLLFVCECEHTNV